MLKKILNTFFICLEAIAIQAPPIDDYINFKKSLKLTPWQSRAIEEVELQTKKKNDILRQKSAKVRKEIVSYNENCQNECFKRLPELREEMKSLDNKMYKNILQQDALILEILYPWQKERYKEYRSRVY